MYELTSLSYASRMEFDVHYPWEDLGNNHTDPFLFVIQTGRTSLRLLH